jgi:YVTN family beta-propeller protein
MGGHEVQSVRRRRPSLLTRCGAWIACLVLTAVATLQASIDRRDARPGDRPPAAAGHAVREGVAIDFEVRHADWMASQNGTLREGDNVLVGFTLRDAGSNTPLPGLNPAAWMTLARANRDDPRASCGEQARAAISPNLISRPELDLNAYYVLALNADATITVVDPLFGFGGSKLLALVPLQSPGEDWALTADQDRLFVSMPGAGRLAVIDTRSWTVVTNIDVGREPTRLGLQPDEAYVWVAHVQGQGGSVAVVRLDTMQVVARIATGRGPHQIAFSDDNRFAFVTNAGAGTVSIVDVRRLRKVADVALGESPGDIAFSKQARAAYVTLPGTGAVAAIDAVTRRVVARLRLAPGIGTLRFAPDDRLGFVLNGRANTVSVFDAALNRVVHAVEVERTPDQLAFSTRFAYVRHRDSEIVVMMPLEGLDTRGKTASLLEFPGGQHTFGEGARTPLAASIMRSATDNAVLVANARDQAIYYYQEGMAAPMGQFSNYGREPVAVRVVDRSLRETRPGVYESLVRLPEPGDYDAILVIDSPRVVHCFAVSISAGEGSADAGASRTARVEALTTDTTMRSGAPIRIALRMTDSLSGTPVAGVRDAHVLIVAAGIWQTRDALEPEADGVYAVTVTPPSPGRYDVFVTCPSKKMPYRRVFTFEAIEGTQ